jgi:hypothetical protein
MRLPTRNVTPHAFRLSIAGADANAGHFAPMPYGRPPVFTIQTGVEGSSIDIPVRINGDEI